MSAIMVIEIVVGIIILAAAVQFAVRETRRLKTAIESEDIESVDTEQVPERGTEPQAEHQEQKPEQQAEQQLSEVSTTEAN